MADMDSFARLRALHWEETIEDPSARFGLPHVPELDLADFRVLRRPELEAALAQAESEAARGGARAFLRRGQARRALGDAAGALADFQRALDLEPELADARAALGEAAWGRPEAGRELSRALEIDPRHARARLARGAALLGAGRAREALPDLENAAALRPRSPLARVLLGAAEERLGSRARAARSYERAWDLDTTCTAAALLRSRASANWDEELSWMHRAFDGHPVLGFIALQIHRTARVETPAYARRLRGYCFARPDEVSGFRRREAVSSRATYHPFDDRALAEKLLRARPDLAWVQAFFGRAMCYSREGAVEGEAHLARAAALRPRAGWIRAWRGNARIALGDRAGALADFDAAVRLQPHYHRAFVWRAACRTRLGRAREALADLDRALPMDPRYALTYFERARARRATRDFAGAAADLERAFALDERYSWERMLGAEPAARDVARGLRELDRAVAREPSCVPLWIWRGELRLSLGPAASCGAILDFERAVELDPQRALAHAWAGRALAEAGRAAAAVERLRAALALDPSLHPARLWLAEALESAGRAREARRELAEALRRRALSPQAHVRLARLDLAAGRRASARAALGRALRLDGKNAEAHLMLATLKLSRGDARGAFAAAARCVEVAPNLGRAYLARAEASRALGRPADALADYRRVLAEFPYLLNDAQRARAEELLAAA